MRKILGFSLLVFVLDRLSKWFILKNPDFYSDSFIELKLVENRGFYSFSLNQIFLSLLITAVLLLFFVFLCYAFKKKDLVLIAGFSLIIIGGLSNLLDRVIFSYVIDWIRISLIPISVFNLADLGIITGIVILGFSTAKAYKSKDKRYNNINKRS